MNLFIFQRDGISITSNGTSTATTKTNIMRWQKDTEESEIMQEENQNKFLNLTTLDSYLGGQQYQLKLQQLLI